MVVLVVVVVLVEEIVEGGVDTLLAELVVAAGSAQVGVEQNADGRVAAPCLAGLERDAVVGLGRGASGVLGIGGFTSPPSAPDAIATGNGVEGRTNATAPDKAGVRGSGRKGVIGSADPHPDGVAVHGIAGVDPMTDFRVGLAARFEGDVRVTAGTGDGVSSTSTQRNGVHGASGSQAASGVYGENLSGGGYGVAGRSNATLQGTFGTAVLGDNTRGGRAGYFIGTVEVLGPLIKSGGGFQIDHPVDPANRYLNHSFVESPDMMNIYNGNIVTGADGVATVELPQYFEALNQDFRYQLTVVGDLAHAVVSEEIQNNRFGIRTDQPNVKVSWQVTGIRKDAWAQAHRMEAEPEKSEDHRGKYLTPIEHGQPAEAAVYGPWREDAGERQQAADMGSRDPWALLPPTTWPLETAQWPDDLASVFRPQLEPNET